MKLHENRQLFRQAIRATSDLLNIREVYIEKDYWVTNALKLIFTDPIGSDVVFKGGTALSKCYRILPRFSEDIDLVVYRRDTESDTSLKNKLKKISSIVSTSMPEIQVPDLTRKRGMNRKTAHEYEKEIRGNYGQVRDFIVIESSWMGHPEPNDQFEISSYIFDMMLEKHQQDMIVKYDLNPFKVIALSVSRTLCEKIMSLVRFSYSQQPIQDLSNKIRNIYDIHLLLKIDSVNDFFRSNEFDNLLNKVAKEDKKSFKNHSDWISEHPTKALIFHNLDNVWFKIKESYSNDFRAMVYGDFPDEREIYDTLKAVQSRLKFIEWDVKEEKKQ